MPSIFPAWWISKAIGYHCSITIRNKKRHTTRHNIKQYLDKDKDRYKDKDKDEDKDKTGQKQT
jgi:hypothetical protein